MASSVQRRKVWLTPTTGVPCSNAAKTRNTMKLAGVPQTTGQILAASEPMFSILWRHLEELLLLNKFFSDCRYVSYLLKYSPSKLHDGAQMAIFCIVCFQRAACSTFQTCILNLHQGHTTCGSMVDIQYPTAEIRRGKKNRNKKEETTGQKYNDRICYAGRP